MNNNNNNNKPISNAPDASVTGPEARNLEDEGCMGF